MEISKSLCMGCMGDNGGSTVCPHCGYAEDTAQDPPFLPVKTVLESRYVVGRVILSNGEGSSYIGYDGETKSSIIIREFLPNNLAERGRGQLDVSVVRGCEAPFKEYLTNFLEYSRAVARMRELSALVPVYNIFQANGTAYTISENAYGMTLTSYLAKNGGFISWEQARALFMPVLSTLSSLHSAGIMHLGIAPDNLIVTKDGKMKLSGFSIAAAHMLKTELKPELFDGYSALEQYGFDGSQGEWTDVYGFCATLYTALTGKVMTVASKRSIQDSVIIPSIIVVPTQVTKAIAKGLEVTEDKRTQTFERLREELSAVASLNTSTGNTGQIDIKKNVSAPPKKKKKKTGRYVLISSGAVIVILLALTMVMYQMFYNKDNGSSVSPPVSKASSEEVSTEPESYLTEDQFTTPKLMGQQYAVIKEDESLSKYNIQLEGYRFDDSAKADEVIDQDPDMETIIKKDQIIKVIVSLGPRMKTVPQLSGMKLADAREKLHSSGLEVLSVIEKYDDNIPAGNVLSTEPASGSKLEHGSKITIYVSGYKSNETIDD